MKAVGMTQFGGPEVLSLVDLPEPQVGQGQVRIRVHAATVNPTDTLLRSGARPERYAGVPPPYVPGMDAAGVLDEIGEAVTTDLRVGDHVMAIVVPEGSPRCLQPAPRGPGRVRRADSDRCQRCAGSNAAYERPGLPRLALDLLGLEPGETLAVTGAAGAVGGYVVELAKADGLRVIADASESDEALVRHLGQTSSYDRSGSQRSTRRHTVA